ncbi:MAG: hypothetical protein FJ088_13155, partial [Deltaproteobacteria bacterium]|nr:hypothetical protein [Deltaproteobacteria bacterium]
MRSLFLFSIAILVLSAETASAQEAVTALYKGKIVDEGKKPLSGIFNLQFTLLPDGKSKKTLWTERHFVAVEKGVYSVELGTLKKFPSGIDLSSTYISISLVNGGEILREPFVYSEVHAQPKEVAASKTDVKKSNAEQHEQQSGKSVSFAETAKYAVEAEYAKNAEKLSNLTLAEIEEKLASEGRIGGAKIKIGGSKKYTNRVGGTGGTSEYLELCPKGYVVTGMRGGAGIYLDSIQLIC